MRLPPGGQGDRSRRGAPFEACQLAPGRDVEGRVSRSLLRLVARGVEARANPASRKLGALVTEPLTLGTAFEAEPQLRELVAAVDELVEGPAQADLDATGGRERLTRADVLEVEAPVPTIAHVRAQRELGKRGRDAKSPRSGGLVDVFDHA